MKYYVIEISTIGDKVSPSIYTYNTMAEAEASYHKKLGGAMGNADFVEETILVTDSDGNRYFDLTKHFIRPSAE